MSAMCSEKYYSGRSGGRLGHVLISSDVVTCKLVNLSLERSVS